MATAASSTRTGQVAIQNDPSRRPDVLLRRRLPDGHRVNAWWMIGAFAAVSFGVIGILNLFPNI